MKYREDIKTTSIIFPYQTEITYSVGIATNQEKLNTKGYNDLLKNPNEFQGEFVRRLWDNTALQKKGGSLKYTSMMSPGPSKDDVKGLLEKLRFIAFRLTGQLKPEDFNWDGRSPKRNYKPFFLRKS